MIDFNEYTDKGFYLRGVNSLEDIQKNSIDILDSNMVELSDGIGGIDERLTDCNLNSWETEELEDGSIKITYSGVNALEDYQEWIHSQYKYIAVLDGECLGDNFNGDGTVISVNNIIAVFNQETGEEIKF